jgi:hypothetical protein
VRRALAHLVAHTRAVYRRAEPGIDLLEPVSRACVRCAFTLYQGILDEIERAGYHVLHRRVAVSNRRRAAVALPGLARALVARARPAPPTSPRAGALLFQRTALSVNSFDRKCRSLERRGASPGEAPTGLSGDAPAERSGEPRPS